MKKILRTLPRYLLGLIYFVFGLNFFLHFIPMPENMPEALVKFTTALVETGYFMQFVKTVEIICGALLLANFFTPLALIILAPISLHILLIHIFIETSGLPMALIIVALHVYLGISHLPSYKEILKAR